MEVLAAFLIALLVGAVVGFVASLLPAVKRYATGIGVAAFVVSLLVQLGLL